MNLPAKLHPYQEIFLQFFQSLGEGPERYIEAPQVIESCQHPKTKNFGVFVQNGSLTFQKSCTQCKKKYITQTALSDILPSPDIKALEKIFSDL